MKSIVSTVFLIAVAICVDCRLLSDPVPQTDLQPAIKSARVQPNNETTLTREEEVQMDEINRKRNLLRGSIQCDSPYIRVGDKCLWFSDIKLNWTEAEKDCIENEEELVNLETWRDSIELHSYYLKNYGCERFWLGASDMDVEGTWEWTNNGPVTDDQVPWICGQPDEYKSREDCLELGYKSGFNDVNCSYSQRYVCERASWGRDYRCANGNHDFVAPNGAPAECNGLGGIPCCSLHGWCGISSAHCDCPTCIDYRDTTTSTTESYSTTGLFID